MPTTKHSTYQGIEITIDGDGEFRAVVDGRPRRSGSLKSLKSAIDAKLRTAARLGTSALKAVVLVQRGWSSYDHNYRAQQADDWYVGTFDGIDAHTGDCFLKLEDGRRVDVGYGFWLRADNVDGIEEVKRVLAAYRAAEAAKDKAEQELRAALAQHGRQVATVMGHNRTKAAVGIEQQMVEFLGATITLAPENPDA